MARKATVRLRCDADDTASDPFPAGSAPPVVSPGLIPSASFAYAPPYSYEYSKAALKVIIDFISRRSDVARLLTEEKVVSCVSVRRRR
jgi:hypothetical protein